MTQKCEQLNGETESESGKLYAQLKVYEPCIKYNQKYNIMKIC